VPIDATPPNLRDEMCGGKRKRPATDEDEATVASNAGSGGATNESGATFFAAGLQPPMPKPSELIAQAPAPSEPIPVYTGPTRTGAALIAAVAADSEAQAVKPRGKKTRVASGKPAAADKSQAKSDAKSDAKPDAKSDAKSDTKQAAKPAAARHAAVKPEAAAKPAPTKPGSAAAAADKPASKLAKPKASTSGSAAPAAAAPKAAGKPKNESKPAG
jgi:D-alanyl-D-alanine carboxypeptidase